MHPAGRRIHVITIEQHDGSLDDANQPTYDNADDWDDVIVGLPVELLSVSGGETVRGQQMEANTTHLAIADYFSSEGVTELMRFTYESETYHITNVRDPKGTRRERFMQCRTKL